MVRAIRTLLKTLGSSCLACLLVGALLAPATSMVSAEGKLPKPLVSGLKNPESVAVWNGKIYVSVIGEFDKDGDGAIVEIRDGKAVLLVSGLDDPKGIVAFQQWLFVADKKRVL